ICLLSYFSIYLSYTIGSKPRLQPFRADDPECPRKRRWMMQKNRGSCRFIGYTKIWFRPSKIQITHLHIFVYNNQAIPIGFAIVYRLAFRLFLPPAKLFARAIVLGYKSNFI